MLQTLVPSVTGLVRIASLQPQVVLNAGPSSQEINSTGATILVEQVAQTELSKIIKPLNVMSATQFA